MSDEQDELRELAEELIDMMDSSPKTAELIAGRYPGLDHMIDLIRRNLAGDEPEETNVKNFGKVARGKHIVDVPLPEVITGPPPGGCKTCGCPIDQMPMVNRGTGWCSENHRKEQESQ